MKAAWVLVFLAVCAVLAVTFQVVKQEINIYRMKNIILSNTEEVKTKEDEILRFKTEVQKLSSQMAPIDKQKNELTVQLDGLVKEKESSETNLNTCQLKKTEVQKQKTEQASAIETLRQSQNQEIQKVKDEVERLQKQILERDKSICLHVDKQRQEAKALCNL